MMNADLYNAKIRDFTLKDQKYCFEVVAANPGKKGMKKYTFAALTESDYNTWLQALRKCSNPADTMEPTIPNPIHDVDIGIDASRSSSTVATVIDEDKTNSAPLTAMDFSLLSDKHRPAEKRGYLLKKSPAMLKGWQKRYFVMKDGEIVYYQTVRDFT